MTATRIVVPGATTALTRRTTLRKAFLGPWHPLVDDMVLYSLADAQRQEDVAVHHTTRVPTHHHTNVTPSRNNLPAFTRRFHRDVSCGLHALLCELRYDAPRELFDDRPTHKMRLVDAPAQASHLVYEHLNNVAAGIVERPEHMPGRTLDFGLWKTGFIEVRRPALYFDNSRPEVLRLELTPPPLLYRAFGGDLDRLIHHMTRLVEGGIRALRDARTRPVLGPDKAKRIHPWGEPRTMREPGGRPVPTFRIGAHSILGTLQRIDAAREVHHFRRCHEQARIARRDGDLEQLFPFGTYAQRAYHGAPVQNKPPQDAVIARPGPLLADVKAELEQADLDRDALRANSFALLDHVRDAFAKEAPEILDDAHLDLLAPREPGQPLSDPGTEPTGKDTSPRAPAAVRHRLDPAQHTAPDDAPARIITLRDRRPTKPPPGRHGSDPPS